MDRKPWHLAADIGGTNARFALAETGSIGLDFVRQYPVGEYATFAGAMDNFLSDVAATVGWKPLPEAACLAVAGATEGSEVQLTNSRWTISGENIAATLGDIPVTLINDFAAAGEAIPALTGDDWKPIGGGTPVPGRPIAVLGPGTGLGVCTLVFCGTDYLVIEGEGGHVDFAPLDGQEAAVFRELSARFGRVSVERLLSGEGIMNIYGALAAERPGSNDYQLPAQVTEAALNGSNSLAVQTLALFCRVLGAVAGNLALTVGARGGVYVAGGIVPRIVEFLRRSGFRERFEAKGRFRGYLAEIPVRVIVKQDLGLTGAMMKLRRAL